MAQLPDYHVQLFDQSYGLKTNLEKMIKDKRGFTWMVSSEMILRFDGKNTKEFPNDEFLLSIVEDPDGNVWVNSAFSIYRFANEHLGFIPVPFDTTGGVSLGKMFRSPSNTLWLQASKGFYEWNQEKNEFVFQDLSEAGVPSHISTSSFSIFQNTLFFAEGDSIYAVDVKAKTKHTLPRISLQGGMYALSATDVLGTSRGDSTSWCDFKAGTIKRVDFKDELPGSHNDFLYIRDAIPIYENKVILATHSGLLELNMDTRKFRQLRLYHKGYPLDPSPNYFDIYLDDERKMWIMHALGLISFAVDKETIGLIREREAGGKYTWPNNARNIVEDEKGNLWLATSEGFGYWDQHANTISMYRPTVGAKDKLNVPSVRGMNYDGKNVILGTSSSGVWLFNPATSTYRRPTYSNDSTGIKLQEKLEVDFIKQIKRLPGGDFMIVARDCYVMQQDHYLVQELDISSHTTRQPSHCFIDNEKSIWLGTQDGLILYDSSLAFKNHWHTKMNMLSLQNYEDDKLLAGTSEGVYIIDFVGDSIRLIKNEKLASLSRIAIVTKDKDGRYWIASNEGLTRYDPVSQNVELFDYTDNVQGNVWAMEATYTRDGTLYLGGNNGINYFHPGRIEHKKEHLQVTIMNIAVNQDDTSYYDRSALNALRYFENSIYIEFVSAYYGNPNRLQYRYQLLGLSPQWQNIGNSNDVRFTRLPPGNYIFNVAASVNGTQWFQSSESLSFNIAAPFWQRWWFVTGLILLASAVILYFLMRRIKSIQQKESLKRDYERKIAEVEMHALRAQMNPHFMFNSLNSINNFILKNDPENASGYLTKFSRLMRLILDNSRSEWILLENELKALELYIQLEVVRFDEVFEYELILDPSVDIATTYVPPMIIQPYVENAIWHGLLHRHAPGGKLVIRIWRENEVLHINVEDNGVGRREAALRKSKSATKQKSHGLKITAERIDIVNRIYNVDAKIKIDDLTGYNGTATGTKVSLTLKDKLHDSYHRG